MNMFAQTPDNINGASDLFSRICLLSKKDGAIILKHCQRYFHHSNKNKPNTELIECDSQIFVTNRKYHKKISFEIFTIARKTNKYFVSRSHLLNSGNSNLYNMYNNNNNTDCGGNVKV